MQTLEEMIVSLEADEETAKIGASMRAMKDALEACALALKSETPLTYHECLELSKLASLSLIPAGTLPDDEPVLSI